MAKEFVLVSRPRYETMMEELKRKGPIASDVKKDEVQYKGVRSAKDVPNDSKEGNATDDIFKTKEDGKDSEVRNRADTVTEDDNRDHSNDINIKEKRTMPPGTPRRPQRQKKRRLDSKDWLVY